jgi:glycerol-3-phosphate O-acyltransferase
MQQPINNPSSLPPIIPDIEQWPIYKLSSRRYEFIQEVINASVANMLKTYPTTEALLDELARTVYQERIRLTDKPWAADPEDEKDYWADIKKRLVRITSMTDQPQVQEEEAKEMLNSIVSHYTNEIVGNFDPSIYEFAKRALPFGFSRLLRSNLGLKFKEKLSQQFSTKDRFVYEGDLDSIRELAKTHTVIIVPTHITNLDSMVIGWAIHEMGLPAFIYGAGLNLFGIRIVAYFIERLGAYKIDRRKKHPLYIETLKEYSKQALHDGVHSLFFPGGTRSRSGEVEKRLKLGLIGTAMDAQYLNFVKAEKNGGTEPAKKIIVVPVTISYHFVLEAPGLIEDHLKSTGKEQYLVENDRFSTSFKMLSFIWKFFTKSSKIYLSFAPPMDLFGNSVNQQGVSIDKRGEEIDIRGYFLSGGELRSDQQRNDEYVKLLGEVIVQKFHQCNVAFSSHLVAYVAFTMLKKRFRRHDLYDILRLPKEDRVIPYADFTAAVERVRDRMFELEAEGRIKTARHFHEGTLDDLISHGIANVGLYHNQRTLMRNREGDVTSEDLKLLLFYHNRLEGYQLAQYV